MTRANYSETLLIFNSKMTKFKLLKEQKRVKVVRKEL